MAEHDITEEELQTRERLTRVEEKLDNVLSNHLPHLKEIIDRVDERSWYILSAIILEFLVGIAVYLFTR